MLLVLGHPRCAISSAPSRLSRSTSISMATAASHPLQFPPHPSLDSSSPVVIRLASHSRQQIPSPSHLTLSFIPSPPPPPPPPFLLPAVLGPAAVHSGEPPPTPRTPRNALLSERTRATSTGKFFSADFRCPWPVPAYSPLPLFDQHKIQLYRAPHRHRHCDIRGGARRSRATGGGGVIHLRI